MLTLKRRDYKLANGSPAWSWQIQGTCPWTGQPLRIGTRTRDKKLAEDKLHLLLERRRDHVRNGDAPIKQNFAAAIIEYLAKGGEDKYLHPLLAHFGKWELTSIRDQDLSEFCAAEYPGAKASTLVRHVYGPMQWIFNAAARADMCPARTFAKPTVKRVPARYARSDDWLMAVLAACTNLEQRCVLLFMSFSGARASEVIRVTVGDYNPTDALVALGRTKNGKERIVPLSALVNDALRLLVVRDRPATEPLFGYASRYSLNRILKRACRRAGVEHLSPHKAGRHSFAARLLRDGASLKELQQAGGWDDMGVVARHYGHLEHDVIEARIRNVATPIQADAITLGITMDNTESGPVVRPIEKKRKNG